MPQNLINEMNSKCAQPGCFAVRCLWATKSVQTKINYVENSSKIVHYILKVFPHTNTRRTLHSDVLGAGRPQRSIHKSTADTRFLGILICIFIFRCHAWSMIIDQSRFHWVLTTRIAVHCARWFASFHLFGIVFDSLTETSTQPMFDSDMSTCIFILSLSGDVHSAHTQCIPCQFEFEFVRRTTRWKWKVENLIESEIRFIY